jgi:glycosyltransferase involved in cell wall biosynthesis
MCRCGLPLPPDTRDYSIARPVRGEVSSLNHLWVCRAFDPGEYRLAIMGKMTYPPVSVAIPVYNEEKTIENTLLSVLNQSYPGRVELLVCPNGCTDGTEDIVGRLASVRKNLRVIALRERGKPLAWNTLLSAASHRYVFFVDGDVAPDRRAFETLFRTLREGDGLIAVGARPVLNDEHRSFLLNCAITLPGPIGSLVGRLYCLDRERFMERMRLHNFSGMPSHIINDDLWVTFVIGPQRWAEAPDALVYYAPPSNYDDLRTVMRRNLRGEKQLMVKFPDLYAQNRRMNGGTIFHFIVPHNLPSRFRPYLEIPGFRNKLTAFIGLIVRKIMLVREWKAVCREDSADVSQGWETAPSTKVPVDPHEQVKRKGSLKMTGFV